MTIDQGYTRTTGHYLQMEGFQDSNALAAVAVCVWQYQNLEKLSNQSIHRPTKSEQLALVNDMPELRTSLEVVPARNSGNLGGRSLLAFCHWAISQRAGYQAATDFIESLVTGSSLSPDSAILYARNRLLDKAGRMRPNEKAELILRTWNQHRRGRHKTKIPLSGTLPEIER